MATAGKALSSTHSKHNKITCCSHATERVYKTQVATHKHNYKHQNAQLLKRLQVGKLKQRSKVAHRKIKAVTAL
jgi:hypothetical protein